MSKEYVTNFLVGSKIVWVKDAETEDLIRESISEERIERQEAIADVENDLNNEAIIRANEDAVLRGDIGTEENARIAAVRNIQNQINNIHGLYGSPSVANTADAMTDTNKVYVYTGSEAGMVNGNWYYYNGTAWVSGGTYNSSAITTDKTLSVTNMPADAKAVGDVLNGIIPNYLGLVELDWEVGAIGVNGNDAVAANYVRTSNYIPVNNSNEYFLRSIDHGLAYVFEYDVNKNFISRYSDYIPKDAYLEITPETAFIRLACRTYSGADATPAYGNTVLLYKLDSEVWKNINGVTEKVYTNLNQYLGLVNFDWESGSISTQNGNTLRSEIYIRTADFYEVIGTYQYVVSSDIDAYIFRYDSDKEFISANRLTDSGSLNTGSASFIKFAVKRSVSSSAITDYEGNKLIIRQDSGIIYDMIDGIYDRIAKTTGYLNLNWESGTIGPTGNEVASSVYIRTDYVEIEGGTILNLNTPRNYRIYVFEYDIAKAFISRAYYTGSYNHKLSNSTRFVRFVGCNHPPIDIDTSSSNNFVVRIANNESETITKADLFTNDVTQDIVNNMFASFKKFAVIGDSMAAGHVYRNPASTGSESRMDDYTISWATWISRKYRNTVYNFSREGMTAELFKNNTYESTGKSLSTALNGENDSPLYFIGLGLNDGYAGDVSDIDLSDKDNNANTFYGNLAYIVQAIVEYYGDNQPFIILITPPYYPSSGAYASNIANAIRDIYEYIKEIGNIYLMDLEANYSNFFDTASNIYLDNINSHLTSVGYNACASIINREIGNIIYDNMNKFNRIEFLPSNTY